MSTAGRPVAFWIFAVFLALSIIVLLMGQTMAVFDYDRAVRLGLQEDLGQVGAFGVQVNRALGAADTAVWYPVDARVLGGSVSQGLPAGRGRESRPSRTSRPIRQRPLPW